MNIFKLPRLVQVSDTSEYDADQTTNSGGSQNSHDSQPPKSVVTTTDGKHSELEKSDNIQESLSLLHGMANLIIEHGFQISTAGNLSLTAIAQEFVSGPPAVTEALSLLFNDNKTTISTHFDCSKNNHADVFHALIMATGQMIDITAIKSEMIAGDAQCVVTFQTGTRTQRWKFRQPGHQMAKSFLAHAIKCIETSANGQFVIHRHQDAWITCTFIPRRLHQILAVVLETETRFPAS